MKTYFQFKKFIPLLLGIIIVPNYLSSQIHYGGQPFNWDTISKKDIGICGEYILPPDLDDIHYEDSLNQLSKSDEYRFGVEIEVEFNNDNSGVFHYQPNGDRIWYLPIRTKDALALSVRFSKFKLLPGAKVFIWDQKKESFLGAFTHENNKPWGSLATGLIGSDRIIVEVYEPKKTIGYNTYEIDQVVYAYRDILSFKTVNRDNLGPFGTSGECNVNVSCPEGSSWQDESSSVGLVLNGGTVPCNGVMVNNTNEDGTPYILTAEHCLNSNLNDWVFYFNYQSEECDGETGQLNQTVSGCYLVSSNEGADIALLMLSEIPPPSYEVCYAGWDNTDVNDITLAMGIHHPNGDLKKLCIEEDGLSQVEWQGLATWQCEDWDTGVTEMGSSGSPLFDQDHKAIGILSGGEAFCSGNQDNGQPDWYGRIGEAWEGSSPQSRLKDWLDPNGYNTSELDTYCPELITYDLDVQILEVQNFPETLCSTSSFNPVIVLKNNGQLTLNNIDIAFQYNSLDTAYTNWVGNLEPYTTTEFILPAFTPEIGTNHLYVETLSINAGIFDENGQNNSITQSSDLIVGEVELNISLLTDDFGYETYWEIRNENEDVMIYGGNVDMGISGAGAQNATPDDLGAYENNTWYYETFSVPESSCYIFEIADDYGDGICCDFGEGQFILTDVLGNTLYSGASFESNEIASIYMESLPTSVTTFEDHSFQVYPNPARDNLNIEMSNSSEPKIVSIINGLGELVYIQNAVNYSHLAIDIQSLSTGIYTVRVHSDNSLAQKKIIIR